MSLEYSMVSTFSNHYNIFKMGGSIWMFFMGQPFNEVISNISIGICIVSYCWFMYKYGEGCNYSLSRLLAALYTAICYPLYYGLILFFWNVIEAI